MSIDFDTPGSEVDQPDWLAEGSEPGEPMGDDDGGGGSRLFLILAIGLAGLIILGLVAVGGLLYIRRARDAQTIVQITPPPAVQVEEVVPTATFTPTPMPPTVTSAPTIAPTNTRVVQADANAAAGSSSGNGEQASAGNGSTGNGAGSDSGGTSAVTGSNGRSGSSSGNTSPPSRAPTAVPAPATGMTEVPNTGFGGLELALIAVSLVFVVLITRRLRYTS